MLFLILLLQLAVLLAGCATSANSNATLANAPAQSILPPPAPPDWVTKLTDELAHGKVNTFDTLDEGSGVKFTLPQGFTKYHESRWFTRAVSAASVCIKVTRQDNVKDGTLDYWTALIQRTLATTHGLAIQPPRALVLDDGKSATLLEGVKQSNGVPMGYLVAYTITPRHVYLYEAWGPHAAFAAALPALETSVKSMQVSWMADVLF